MNQKKSIALTTTFVGLVCGFVLTQQQAAAAATNAPDPTATSMVAPQSTLTTKSAKSNEPNPNEQLVNQQTSTQKAVTNTDIGSETVNQNQIPRTQSTVSPATNISKEPATSNNNPTTSAQPQQETVAQNTAATSSANSANEATQPVSPPTVPATPQATDSTNNVNTASATTDPQVETIAQGTWGTSKWEYTHQGDDYILHFHAGTLGASSHGYVDSNNYFLGSIGKSPEIFNGNWQWNEELTQIIIDPGVIANQDSSYLFGNLRNLQKIIGLANLDTANVTNMSKMFESYQGASLDLSHFDTSNVTNMSEMFEFYKGPQLDFSHLNTANVTNMSEMFERCDLTNLDLSNFNTANVTDMSYMFAACGLTSLNLSHFNTDKVTNMRGMFESCGLTNLDLSKFNTTNVTNMSGMFARYKGSQLDLSQFDNANVTDMSWMFLDYQGANLDLSHFNTANVTNMAGMFYGYKGSQLDFSNFNTTNVTDMSWMFADYQGANLDLSHFNTANVTNMAGMFDGYQGSQLDLNNFDTSKVTDMSYMFAGYEGPQLDFSHFNTANVTDMSWMFANYQGPQLDFSYLNTANVTDMSSMFEGCKLTSLDLSNFNTANVTNMEGMFYGCNNITSLDLNNFNTEKVTDMHGMFKYCKKLTSVDLSSFNTAKVIDMSEMFDRCSQLTNLDLSNFDTAKVTDMAWMFGNCYSLTSLDLSSFNTGKVNDMDMQGIFDNCMKLNHLILGPDTLFNTNAALPHIPKTGTHIPGTEKTVTSPYWIATSGYQQGHKYTADELMELTGRDQVTTYDWDSTPAFTQTTETKGVTRAIRIHQLDGNTKTEIQSVMISRPVTLNADGSKTYGAWSTAQWDAYAIPEIAGYTASVNQIPAQTVDSNTTNQTIDVYYEPQEQTVEIQYLDHGQIVGTQKITGYTGDTIMPNYHAPQGYEITSITPATITIDGSGKQIVQVNVSHKQETSVEYKTVIRTINLHQINGQMKTYKQTVLLQRGVQRDAVTGNKTYGQWNTGYWDAFNIPVIDGYTASQDQVAAQLVTDQDSDQTIDVYYTPTASNELNVYNDYN